MSNQLAAPHIDAKRRYLCRHIHTSGHRCASPALLEQQFCFYHNASRRPAPVAGKFRFLDAAEPFVLPVVEDRASALLVASLILGRIASNDLDPTRATRLLYGLQVAGSFLPREPRELRETRAAASTSDSSPVPANLRELIEQPILDETLGPIAPIAEFFPPESQGPRNRVTDMIEMTKRELECPTCSAELRISYPRGPFSNPYLVLHDQEPATTNSEPAPTNPEPATLPTLHAVAASVSSACAVPQAKPIEFVTPSTPREAVLPAKPKSPQMIVKLAPYRRCRPTGDETGFQSPACILLNLQFWFFCSSGDWHWRAEGAIYRSLGQGPRCRATKDSAG